MSKKPEVRIVATRPTYRAYASDNIWHMTLIELKKKKKKKNHVKEEQGVELGCKAA